ncbi:MAG: TrmH family RNA methyltransferase [Acidobacteriota bacterium]
MARTEHDCYTEMIRPRSRTLRGQSRRSAVDRNTVVNEPIAVRCPSPSCAAVFTVPPEQLGHNGRCPSCGIGLTARPLAVEEQLRAQETTIRGLATSPLPRLPLVVLADNIRSLWNVGSIFRTADACGVKRLLLTGITGHPPRPEIAKTALGADQVVAWDYRASAFEALAEIRAEGYVPVAVETGPAAMTVDDFVWPRRVCLVIGNEVAGVSPPILAACAHHVSIPMRGMKDSLNVAVAFGIVAHAASRSLAGS